MPTVGTRPATSLPPRRVEGRRERGTKTRSELSGLEPYGAARMRSRVMRPRRLIGGLLLA